MTANETTRRCVHCPVVDDICDNVCELMRPAADHLIPACQTDFSLQRDSGDEQPDEAHREFAENIERRFVVTNIPRAGESAEATAARTARRNIPVPVTKVEREVTELRIGDHTSVLPPSQDRIGRERDSLEAARRDVLKDKPGTAEAPKPEGFKENNPKDAFGILKASMSWVPQAVVMELALAMAEGGFKYGGMNYLAAAPRSTVYTDGAERHIFQYHTLGQDTDDESGADIHHLTKAIASLAVLRAAQINNHWIDDRPEPMPADFLVKLNKMMERLAEKFPNPVARYLAGGKRGPGRIL